MAGVNKVILLGNLGKDPEVKSFDNGRKVARFSLATTESYKDNNGQRVDKTEWHNIVFWGPICDVIEKYLTKGSSIYLEGKIVSRSYDDKDGVKKYITEIEGSQMTMLRTGNGGNAPSTENSSENNFLNKETVSSESSSDDLPF